MSCRLSALVIRAQASEQNNKNHQQVETNKQTNKREAGKASALSVSRCALVSRPARSTSCLRRDTDTESPHLVVESTSGGRQRTRTAWRPMEGKRRGENFCLLLHTYSGFLLIEWQASKQRVCTISKARLASNRAFAIALRVSILG